MVEWLSTNLRRQRIAIETRIIVIRAAKNRIFVHREAQRLWS